MWLARHATVQCNNSGLRLPLIHSRSRTARAIVSRSARMIISANFQMTQRPAKLGVLAVAVLACPVITGAQDVASLMRDDHRNTSVQAVRLSEPLRLDGRLDDPIYRTAPPTSDFVQTTPANNGTPTEKTDAWVFFDDNTIYVCARLWDSAPPEKWTANEMRRDTSQLRQNDHFGVSFDTFHDGRNGYFFYANPLGARADSYMTDETNNNADWNPVWEAHTGRFDSGWTIEMAIPFKSLRYVSGSSQVWGINMRRAIRRKNEWNYLTPLPLSIGSASGMMRVSANRTLTGLDLPSASRNLEIKPYALGSVTTDRTSSPQRVHDFDRGYGFDAKYGITANLTADATFKTDFAQVEIDEQQVNLTRFSLLFPEKREFFLEGRGIFDFGRGGGGVAADTPQLFYSRRIGLNSGRVVPIGGGGRLTGKVGGLTVGAINIQADDNPGTATTLATPATNFTVLRVKRDVLRRSNVGLMFTNRSASTVADGSNQAYGADAAFSFFDNISMGGYYARTETAGTREKSDSYQARFNYDADRYGLRADFTSVAENFNPEVGFLRRPAGFNRSAGTLRFSPRPKRMKAVRQVTYEASIEYIENAAGHLESRSNNGHVNVEMANSDQYSIDAGENYEGLTDRFRVAPTVFIPAGGYEFKDATIRYIAGQQRRVSGTVALQVGQFYDGTIQTLTVSSARASITHQLSVEPSVSINRVDVSAGRFTTQVFRARSDFGFTPRMFASGLLQYGSAEHAFSSNLRFRWEYRPGSELFVVYTDERDTNLPGLTGLKNKAVVVKINRLWQW